MKKEAKPETVRSDRRDFLRIATVGTAAAAAAGAGALPAKAAVATKETGYVETKHVRTYYETCRF